MIHRLHASNPEEARERLRDFDLTEAVRNLHARVLIVMGRQDGVFPAADTEQMAGDAGDMAELVMFEDGNHVCNNIPYKYRPLQADWMRRQLSLDGGP
jgi:2,6-dihydroxypseudooxynicotine hydrolase